MYRIFQFVDGFHQSIHLSYGFCLWNLLALIVTAILVVVLVVHAFKQKKRRKKMEEKLEELQAQKAAEPQPQET